MPELMIYALAAVVFGTALWFGRDIWKAWFDAKARVNVERQKHGVPLETRWWKM